jgi:hypothetical protein
MPPSDPFSLVLTTVADLRSSVPTSEVAVRVLWHSVVDDNGGGVFRWKASSTDADDNGMTIAPTGTSTGRWKRVWDGHEVHVEWFGALGNAFYLDVTNKHYYTDSSLSTLAQDNSVPFDRAWKFVLGLAKMTQLLNPTDYVGFAHLMPTLKVGPGAFRVTTEKLFSSAGPYVYSGINMVGAGMNATKICYENPTTTAGATNYLFYNVDRWSMSRIAHMEFEGASETERFYYMSSAGSAHWPWFEYVKISRFFAGVTLTGTANADHLTMFKCIFNAIPAGGTGVWIYNNSQSVNHNLYSCDFEDIRGTGMLFQSGGCVNVHGGSMIANVDGVVWSVTGDGTKIGPGNGTFNFYSTKPELRGNSRLGYLKAYATVNIYSEVGWTRDDETGSPLPADRPRMIIDGAGQVNVHNSRWRYVVQVHSTIDLNNVLPEINFVNCQLDRELAHLVSFVGSDVPGRASATGCTLLTPLSGYLVSPLPETSEHPPTLGLPYNGVYVPADVHLNAEWGNSTRAAVVKRYVFRVGTAATGGLPKSSDAGVNHTFAIPMGATLLRVGIVHDVGNTSYGVFSYNVVNYSGVILVSMSAVDAGDRRTTVSPESYLVATTEEQRVFRVNQTSGNAPQRGFVFVDYI